MRAHYFPIAGGALAAGGVVLCWILTLSLGHNEPGRIPFISQTGTEAPERYIFTFSLGTAAVLFAISGYMLFRRLQFQYQDLADYYFGFVHASARDDDDDDRYHRERISIWGSEKAMTSYLPKANYFALALSFIACACLLFLAIVDLKDAAIYHGSASAMFFGIGLVQGLLLILLIYSLRRVQTRRSNSLHFYLKVATLLLCIFFTFPVAIIEGITIALTKIDYGEDMKHNIGAMNQYLLTMSLLLHYSTYCADLRAVQITPNLQFDPIDGIITIGGRHSGSASVFFDEEVNVVDVGTDTFTIGGDEEQEEDTTEREHEGIHYVNKGSFARKETEMKEVIPMEELHLPNS